MQCRIVVNALRREIDRLMRGIDRYDSHCCGPTNAAMNLRRSDGYDSNHFSNGSGAEFAKLASPAQSRKLYAVAPLGMKLAAAPQVGSPSNAMAVQSGASHATGGDKLGAIIDTLG